MGGGFDSKYLPVREPFVHFSNFSSKLLNAFLIHKCTVPEISIPVLREVIGNSEGRQSQKPKS